DLPPEGLQELKQVELVDRARATGRAGFMYLVWLVLMPIGLVMGVRNWPVFGLLVGMSLAMAIYSFWMSRSPSRATPTFMRPFVVGNFLLVGVATSLFSPFVVVPALAATSGSSMVIAIRANATTRRFVFGSALLSVFVPALLAFAGFLPPSFTVDQGMIHIHPGIVSYP